MYKVFSFAEYGGASFILQFISITGDHTPSIIAKNQSVTNCKLWSKFFAFNVKLVYLEISAWVCLS